MMIVVVANAFAINGMGMECVQFFGQIPVNMLNEAIYTSVLNGCSHSGLINEAREIFEKIPVEKRTEKIYTTMVNKFS
jgi:pentatricopeptide repeat protein